MIACGFGTAYQGLLRANVSGNDRVLVMGQGPVGQAAIILAKALGAQTIAVDIAEERLEMAKQIGADEVLLGDDNMVENVMKMTGGKGVEVAIDCSGSSIGRHRCLEVARMWGNVVFLGEQGTVTFEPSPLLLHKNLTLHGSWVTSVANMEKLVELLGREVKEDELSAGLEAQVIATDGIAVVVNNNNPTDELTSDQVKSIYTGEALTWDEVVE